MSLFQIIVLLLIALVIAKALARFRRREISFWLLAGWSLVWLAAALVVIFPQILNRLADVLGVGRGVDLVIYFALAVLFYWNFKLHLQWKKCEQNQTEIVRRLALREVSEEHKQLDK